MPYSGADPYEHGTTFDPVGQSLDWSTYHLLSPGGRFPNDLGMFLEWLAASDPGPGRDPGSPNPGFEIPSDIEERKGILAAILRQIERDQRAGGIGPVSNPLEAGPPYLTWSGPGARFGPEGGPLHGLLDQGGDRLLDRDYGPEPAPPSGAEPPKGKGGGGEPKFNFQFQPYEGTTYTPQFQGWDPTQPFTNARPPSGPGKSSITPAPGAPVLPPGKKPKPPKGGGGGKVPAGPGGGPGAPGGGGKGGGPQQEAATTPPGGTPGPSGPAGPPPTLAEVLAGLRTIFDQNPDAPGLNPAAFLREGGFRGYDPGFLDKGTPGWTRDPSLGILNTAGMPRQTPRSKEGGESLDEYMTYLHDLGYDNESILGLLNKWGAGEVMRDPFTGDLGFSNLIKEPNVGGIPDEFGIFTGGVKGRNVFNDPNINNPRLSEGMREFLGGGGGVLGDMFHFGGRPVNAF